MASSILPQGLKLAAMQTTWASQLNPLIQNPVLQTNLLTSITLRSGTNVINHGLGRKLQGWYIVRMRNGAAATYDTQDSNPSPTLTLNLNSSANVVVDLVVF